jgi:hypothetical protein
MHKELVDTFLRVGIRRLLRRSTSYAVMCASASNSTAACVGPNVVPAIALYTEPKSWQWKQKQRQMLLYASFTFAPIKAMGECERPVFSHCLYGRRYGSCIAIKSTCHCIKNIAHCTIIEVDKLKYNLKLASLYHGEC